MSSWLRCIYCTYVHRIKTIIIWDFSLHAMWWLTKCKYSIHLFESVHICVWCFCEALAGEVTIVLALLALVLGCRTVESWSVSYVSTTFTHVWTNWSLWFWFLQLLSLSMQLPLLRVWLEWLLCWMALSILMPAFPLVHFGFWVALFSDLVDTFCIRIFACGISAFDVFRSCSTSFKLLELLPDCSSSNIWWLFTDDLWNEGLVI